MHTQVHVPFRKLALSLPFILSLSLSVSSFLSFPLCISHGPCLSLLEHEENGDSTTHFVPLQLSPRPPPPPLPVIQKAALIFSTLLLTLFLPSRKKEELASLVMGAGISRISSDTDDGRISPRWRTGLGDIPESCVSLILASLDPPEICKLARVSRAFHGASSADFVWESKLPSNYRFLVRRILGENPDDLSKKEAYSRLCQASCFDGGTKVNKSVC